MIFHIYYLLKWLSRTAGDIDVNNVKMHDQK